MEHILQMHDIVKNYPGVMALDHVDLDLEPGEVLALVGENGAGKSTLMKILGGAESADSGSIVIKGNSYANYSPKAAIDYGIGVIYQELNYLNDLTIAENIYLGRLPRKRLTRSVDYKELNRRSKVLQQKVGIHKDPTTEVRALSVGEKQLVEIARIFSQDINILIFDEPTSALTDTETENLFKLIRECKAEGRSVIYISHRLEEVFEIADRVQVLRDGKSVAVLPTASTDKKEIVHHMVGREIKDLYPISSHPSGDTFLEIKNLTAEKARNVTFDLHKGEIVGLFGLMGSGRTSIVKALFGAIKATGGEILIEGKPVQITSPESALKNGIVYIPSERKTEGLVLSHTVKENISLASLDRIKKGMFLNSRKEATLVNNWVDKLNIKTPSINKEVKELSGGNQQKVVLSKYLTLNPRVIIMNEPTRGIDVGAKVEIYKIIEQLCDEGICVLIISSELPEVMALSDRIVVISNGEVSGICERADGYSQETLLEYAIARMEQ